MLQKIRSWWLRRKIRKEWEAMNEKLDLTVPNTSAQMQIQPIPQNTQFAHIWQDTSAANLLTFTAQNGENVFCIDADGNAKWLKEDSYDEAAEIFLNSMNWTIENAAGIRQSRVEWEQHITAVLVNAAEERGGSISAEELTDVIRKCIMYDKLKGKYG